MERIGYVYLSLDDKYISEQLMAFQNINITNLIINQLDIDSLGPGDELYIYELKSLGKTIVQLSEFISSLKKQKIKLRIINRDSFMEYVNETQLEVLLLELAEVDSFVISERTIKGIKIAKCRGRIGGRPKISEKTVEKIKYLYQKRGYTLREVADECDVSLGTAYKYTQNDD